MIVVNGKPLLNAVTGTERFAWEVLTEWDKIVTPGEVEILVPNVGKKLREFKNIAVKYYGEGNLTLWQQYTLPHYVKKTHATFCSFANNAPFLLRHGLVVLHDVSPTANKTYYNLKNRIKFWLAAHHVTHAEFKIAAVSHFSATEIEKYFGCPADEIAVVGNSWQHMERVAEDENVFSTFPELQPKNYYFSLSSLAPNKNFEWIMDTARKNPNETFAISGGFKNEIFGNVKYDIPANVILLGRTSDEQAKALMRHCKAFLFPTFYEGFGIPPMEAMSCGAGAIVSDTPCMHEIYGDSVTYIDPHIPADKIAQLPIVSGAVVQELLQKYTWQKAATRLLELAKMQPAE